MGGAVRDMLLGGTPKDFDILTSASMNQVPVIDASACNSIH